MVLKSFAKLNLYLKVLNKRPDNYHNIKTVFERISLNDKIILKARSDKLIKIICGSPDVPKDKTNLVYRAADILRKKFGITSGLEIRILKHIPVGAGLGGGSSNAATVLLGLNKLWRLKLTQGQLVSLAKDIGSDVAFFIYNMPFALGSGRGDIIKPILDSKATRLWHVLVVPKIKVSTPFIYSQWDEQSEKLTKAKYNVKITNLRVPLFNSLEKVTSTVYPEVLQVKERLRDLGLKKILMSGSGPAVFALCSSQKQALALGRRLRIEHRQGKWQVFVVRTI